MGLGSNLGDSAAMLQSALQALETIPGVLGVEASPSYRTEPQGFREQPWFLNLAAKVHLEQGTAPKDFMRELLQVEYRLGRRRPAQGADKGEEQGAAERFAPRSIDLDLLLFSNVVLEENDLTLPHPRMRERAFVLVPLHDLEPALVFPDGTTLKDALSVLDYKAHEDVITQD